MLALIVLAGIFSLIAGIVIKIFYNKTKEID